MSDFKMKFNLITFILFLFTHQIVFRAYYLLSTVLSSGNIIMNKKIQDLSPCGVYILVEEADIN